jgi:hypothetical protein
MESFITILIVSLSIGLVFWFGYMWGKMSGYEEGFKACQLIYDGMQNLIKSNT